MKQTKNKDIYIYIIISLLCTLFSSLFFMLKTGDADYYWHTKIGEYIINNKAIFNKDVFSWIAIENGYTETAHSWLNSVTMYLFDSLFGYKFGALLYNAIFCFIFTLIYFLLFYKNYYKTKENFIITILTLILITGNLYGMPRPQNISHILIMLSIYFILKLKDSLENKYIVFLGITSIFLANFHGGMIPLYFGIIGFFMIFSIVPNFNIGFLENKQNIPATKKLFLSEIVAVLGGLINPYTYKLYFYFFLTNDAATKQDVSEFQPASFSTLLFLIILVILYMVMKNIKFNFSLFLLTIFFLACCMKWLRFESYLIIAFLSILPSLNKKIKIKDEAIKLSRFICTIFTILFLIIVPVLYQSYKPYMISDELVDYLKNKKYERLYNNYNEGGLLIYHDIPCFIDSRADLYPGELLLGATDFEFLRYNKHNTVEDFLDKYKFDALLLNSDMDIPLIDYLILKGYNIDFDDEMYCVLIKNN